MLRLLNRASDRLYRKRVGGLAIMIDEREAFGRFQGAKGSLRNLSLPTLNLDAPSTFTALWAETGGACLSGALCNIALPDYEFCYRNLPHTKLPQKKSAEAQFLRWRLEQEVGDAQNGCYIAASEPASQHDSMSVLLLRKERFEEAEKLAAQVGSLTKSFLPLGFYILAQLNCNQESRVTSAASSVLVVLWDNYWTLIATEDDGAVGYFRSCRWSVDSEKETEIGELADEFAFVVRGRSGKASLIGERVLCESFRQAFEPKGIACGFIEELIFSSEQASEMTQKILDVVMNYER